MSNFLFSEENMKTQQLVFSIIILLALTLAACSPQVAPAEAMSGKDMTSETISETSEDKDMEIESDKDDEMVSVDENNDASDHDVDDMMDENKDGGVMADDDAIMGDEGDEMVSDEDGEMDDDDEDMMDQENDGSMSGDKDGMSEDTLVMTPDWFKASLTNVKTGETFTVDDFKGKVVLVETLAMWCSNCLKQQKQVQALHDLIGERDDFVSLGIDIDPNENAEALRTYTSNNGFDWVYTVAPTEVAREIGQLYGDQYLNPPSTPMLIIDREGEVHLLPFGIKNAESLLVALQPFLDAEM
jgi:cytochrome oxidase Cu insertion factor (SCO1/SenC/PrrC family)